jgi:hypothetical protein
MNNAGLEARGQKSEAEAKLHEDEAMTHKVKAVTRAFLPRGRDQASRPNITVVR